MVVVWPAARPLVRLLLSAAEMDFLHARAHQRPSCAALSSTMEVAIAYVGIAAMTMRDVMAAT
jgi:hypothetical protein